jgi:hypothetical protein
MREDARTRDMQREERERIARRNFPWLPPDCSESVRLYKNLGRSKLKSLIVGQEGCFGVEVKLTHYLSLGTIDFRF